MSSSGCGGKTSAQLGRRKEGDPAHLLVGKTALFKDVDVELSHLELRHIAALVGREREVREDEVLQRRRFMSMVSSPLPIQCESTLSAPGE